MSCHHFYELCRSGPAKPLLMLDRSPNIRLQYDIARDLGWMKKRHHIKSEGFLLLRSQFARGNANTLQRVLHSSRNLLPLLLISSLPYQTKKVQQVLPLSFA